MRCTGQEPASGSADPEALSPEQAVLGTWVLQSVQRIEVPSGHVTDLFGPDPQGYINYSPDGRMLVVIVARDRPVPASPAPNEAEALALFRTLVAYGGNWWLEGDVMIHDVDISWVGNWHGTRQERRMRMEGDRLFLELGPNPDPVHGKHSLRRMTWVRYSGGAVAG